MDSKKKNRKKILGSTSATHNDTPAVWLHQKYAGKHSGTRHISDQNFVNFGSRAVDSKFR